MSRLVKQNLQLSFEFIWNFDMGVSDSNVAVCYKFHISSIVFTIVIEACPQLIFSKAACFDIELMLKYVGIYWWFQGSYLYGTSSLSETVENKFSWRHLRDKNKVTSKRLCLMPFTQIQKTIIKRHSFLGGGQRTLFGTLRKN